MLVNRKIRNHAICQAFHRFARLSMMMRGFIISNYAKLISPRAWRGWREDGPGIDGGGGARRSSYRGLAGRAPFEKRHSTTHRCASSVLVHGSMSDGAPL
jgi:hypothetical protein